MTVFDAATAQPGTFELACPGMSRFRVPSLKRAALPKGLTRRAFRKGNVVGVRITVSSANVDRVRQLPYIAGAGLYVTAAEQ